MKTPVASLPLVAPDRSYPHSRPRITIGLPFLDAGDTLELALRSVFAQTLTDWELILIDDGSTDASTDLARSIRDPRVRVITDGVHRGLPARLNQIVQLATSDVIARMDADDAMHPDRLATQVGYLAQHPDVDVLATSCYTMDRSGCVFGKRGNGSLLVDPRRALRGFGIVHPTVTFRTEWARRHPYNCEYPRGEDYELWYRVCLITRIQRLHDPLLFYREPTPVNLRAYVATQRSVRLVISRHGPSTIGTVSTTIELLRVWAKQWLYTVAATLGLDGFLIRRRSDPLSKHEHAKAMRTFEQIRSTPLPGVDDTPPSAVPT